VYCKPTHTNLYLNTKSHHHPSNKQSVLSTVVHKVRALCDEDRLQAELAFLTGIFKTNGYNNKQIHCALNFHSHFRQLNNKPNCVAFLPLAGTIYN
jgi:hypothetical protein